MPDPSAEADQDDDETVSFVDLLEAENCWQKAQTERGGFIIDGATYFRAFREALIQAEKYVCILAWDLMGELELIRNGETDDDYPTKLVDFIYELVERKPELNVYILLWDYSVVYLVEREWRP